MKKIWYSCILAILLLCCGSLPVWASATAEEAETEVIVEEVPTEEDLAAETSEALTEEVPEEVEEEEVLSAQAYSGWYQAYGNYYYFVDGKRAVGWWNLNGNYYYFKKTGDNVSVGKMLTGWQNIGGKTYYFKRSGDVWTKGKLLTGWQNIDGKTYYLKKSGSAGTKGKLLTGWQNISGKTFYFKKSGSAGTKGKLLTGWQNIGGRRFFFKASGAKGTKGEMLTGWWRVGDDTYYFKRSGAKGVKGCILTGWQSIDGTTYRFDSNGRWIQTLEVNPWLSQSAYTLASKIGGMTKDTDSSYPSYTSRNSSGTIHVSSGIYGYMDRVTHMYVTRSSNMTFCNMYIGQNGNKARAVLEACGWQFESVAYNTDTTAYCYWRQGVEDEYIGFVVSNKTQKVTMYEYFFYEM